ncbi:MAG: PilT/PilU family type 4a pilus ATPase [Betaproteobacteria bacterium]|nr:PilT/PilU family type 4a pilus ATPase [Betaproteobacteria bacterium]MBI3057658.1 PilT/PilU family type 4a pilus ATPase [Betaproteobacteria bacterium]
MFVDPLFKLMAEKQASDLFFTAGAPIQIKINGVVMPVNAQVLDPAAVKAIAYEVMSELQIKEFEQKLEMNLGVGRAELGSFRVNVFRQRGAVGMVIRFIKPTIPTLEDLKLPPILRELVMEKLGMILIVGSTGSGKSSSMAAMIDYRNSTRPGHILTIEDPMEFSYKHKKSIVNQREVGMDTASYENALVSAMREAPDLLMIGEIRDRPTLQSALLFAQTGHLCLSTLHANNSYHAMNRIINFFPREAREALLADLSISLKCVMSQRLVRAKSGGRIPAVEVMLNTAHIADLIRKGEMGEIKDAMEKSMAPGSQTFEQALYHLYASDQITLDDALANADSATNLHWLINNAGKAPTHPPAGSSEPTATPAPSGPADDLSSIKLNLDLV